MHVTFRQMRALASTQAHVGQEPADSSGTGASLRVVKRHPANFSLSLRTCDKLDVRSRPGRSVVELPSQVLGLDSRGIWRMSSDPSKVSRLK